MIAAMSVNGVIGSHNKLPWTNKKAKSKYPKDMRRFRSVTKGHPIIMGRKTYESIGKPLPLRENIILTKKNNKYDGCYVAHTLQEALDKASLLNKTSCPIVIGGGEIYKLALDKTTHIYLTIINKYYDGDTYFPNLNQNEWTTIESEDHGEFRFDTLARNSILVDQKSKPAL